MRMWFYMYYEHFFFRCGSGYCPYCSIGPGKGLQMMPMHENVELSFISFFSGSQSPKLVDGDGTSKFLLPLLALSSSSSEDDLFIGPRNISSADMDSCPSMDNYQDTSFPGQVRCILIMKDLVVEQNHDNSD